MVSIINQNILNIQRGIIAHQCNCKGVMNGGLAKGMRNKYPQAYSEYMMAYREGRLSLGMTQLVPIKDGLYVANLMGQDGYGRQGVHTNKEALSKCLAHVHGLSKVVGLPVYLPFGIGCGLGGGEWSEIFPLIELKCPDAILCKL